MRHEVGALGVAFGSPLLDLVVNPVHEFGPLGNHVFVDDQGTNVLGDGEVLENLQGVEKTISKPLSLNIQELVTAHT